MLQSKQIIQEENKEAVSIDESDTSLVSTQPITPKY